MSDDRALRAELEEHQARASQLRADLADERSAAFVERSAELTRALDALGLQSASLVEAQAAPKRVVDALAQEVAARREQHRLAEHGRLPAWALLAVPPSCYLLVMGLDVVLAPGPRLSWRLFATAATLSCLIALHWGGAALHRLGSAPARPGSAGGAAVTLVLGLSASGVLARAWLWSNEGTIGWWSPGLALALGLSATLWSVARSVRRGPGEVGARSVADQVARAAGVVPLLAVGLSGVAGLLGDWSASNAVRALGLAVGALALGLEGVLRRSWVPRARVAFEAWRARRRALRAAPEAPVVMQASPEAERDDVTRR